MEEIRHFLQVAQMAKNGTKGKFSITGSDKNKIVVLAQFSRGSDKSKCEFTIVDMETAEGVEKRIKELRIQFLN